jgi:ATP-dependent RNA helicase TDRD9
VSSSSDGNRVRVRQTTLLPAMPGLSSILSLIFAPRVEFRANSDRTRLTGALCGLGKKEDGSAIYPDHDMELEFDTDISVKVLNYWKWLWV